MRSVIAFALGKCGDARAVDVLINLLGDEDFGVSCDAAQALGRLGEPALLPLLKELNNENERISALSAKALGSLGDKRATASLIQTLKSDKPSTRAESAEALGSIGDLQAVEPLIKLKGLCCKKKKMLELYLEVVSLGGQTEEKMDESSLSLRIIFGKQTFTYHVHTLH